MPFTTDSVDSEQSCTHNSCQARIIKNASQSVPYLATQTRASSYPTASTLGTEAIVELMNGRASMQAIRRSPSPFYTYCVTQPIQSNVCRSTHSSPPPPSPTNKLSPERPTRPPPFSADEHRSRRTKLHNLVSG